jgi:hypothetical protein
MRNVLLLVACGLMAVSFASAQHFGSALPSKPGSGSGNSTLVDDYKWDDGVSENSVGLTAGGELGYLNAFQVAAGKNVLNGIKITFGSPSFPGASGMTVGAAFKVYVWKDPTNDGNPIDAQLLNTTNAVVQAGSIDTDAFMTVGLPNVNVGSTGNWFFIGASVNQAAGTYPSSLDQTSSALHSWVCGSGSQNGFDPNNLNAGIGLFRMDDIGLGGNWLLRGNAIPEPATLALLAVAGLLLRRR